MFHLHIVDNADSVLSSLLFAHFALRCGQLREQLLLSASAAPSNLLSSNTDGSGKPNLPLRYPTDDNDDNNGNGVMRANNDNINENDDVSVLQIAAAMLRGDLTNRRHSEEEVGEDSTVESLPWLCEIEERREAIRKYPFFQTPFERAERSLSRLHSSNAKQESGARKDIAPYFHFILAAQPSTYDYLCDYYSGRRSSASLHLTRLVIFCVGGGDDIKRTVFIAQRFVEGLVGVEESMKNIDGEDKLVEGNKDDEEWVERVDGTLETLSAQYGVDIFVMVT
ncbi:unnamed protein product [Phytomonas sp. EM1]|nr:unnamed protein product [Phytomonas sp. EM1]|eukprot:CCW63565.1 unnamed protein product [Phytomonas sp. isolate EM1]